jgi:hypothetical protein
LTLPSIFELDSIGCISFLYIILNLLLRICFSSNCSSSAKDCISNFVVLIKEAYSLLLNFQRFQIIRLVDFLNLLYSRVSVLRRAFDVNLTVMDRPLKNNFLKDIIFIWGICIEILLCLISNFHKHWNCSVFTLNYSLSGSLNRCYTVLVYLRYVMRSRLLALIYLAALVWMTSSMIPNFILFITGARMQLLIPWASKCLANISLQE